MFLIRNEVEMARPLKERNVCALPRITRFGPFPPEEREGHIIMTVDEYESLRLIDLEGFKQEECAAQMKVARTTVQGIYMSARQKVADALVHGKMLMIEGGEYELCDGISGCGRGCMRRRRGAHRHREKNQEK